jgi:hypothetical protein
LITTGRARGEINTGANQCYSPRAFATELLKHREVVPRADPEILGYYLALLFLWKNSGEKSPTLVS